MWLESPFAFTTPRFSHCLPRYLSIADPITFKGYQHFNVQLDIGCICNP